MNRLTATGIVIELWNDKNVLVLCETQRLAYGAFYEFEKAVRNELPNAKFYRSEGATRVVMPAGNYVMFRSVRARLEGLSPDVILVEEIQDRARLERLYYDQLRPMELRGAELMLS